MSTERAQTRLPAPGDRIAQYEILRELGRGGMGVVYLARDTKLRRRVAIKLMLRSEPEFVRRFMIEARAMARCAHENIGVIHAAEEHEGHPYMVLEYHQGQTLRAWLGDRTLPLPPDQVASLLVPVTRALEYAHSLGIIHRDLKPENIMMTDSGAIKVLDFGIAKLLADVHRTTQPDQADSPEISSETQDGFIIGTRPYMSPEQWGSGSVDHRSDLWAVGIMLFEMAVGRHPLAPLSVSALSAVRALHVPMPSARDAGPELGALADIIDHCLVKLRSDRISSAGELRTRLERLRAHDSVAVDRRHPTILGSSSMSPGTEAHRTGVAAQELEFANIKLDRYETKWMPVPDRPDTSPFWRLCLLYLQLPEDAGAADLPLDVTILNLAVRPVTLSHVGLEIVEIHPRFDRLDPEDLVRSAMSPDRVRPRAIPSAHKVEKQDTYVLEGQSILRLLMPHVTRFMRAGNERGGLSTVTASDGVDVNATPVGREAAVVPIGETVWSQLDDPIYLEPGAPYRFGVLVRDVMEHLPSNLILRLAARTQLGATYSSPIELYLPAEP